MFVNGLPFFLTMSRQIRFLTVQYVPHRTAGELANVIKQVLKLYHRAGFTPVAALMDGEFDKVKDKLVGDIEVNTTSANEHVGEIERKIKHVKERCRCTTADLPYEVLPNKMIKALVITNIMFLNTYPDKQGVSEEFSPRELVLRWQLGAKHLQHHFGAYGLAYNDPTVTNTMQERGTEAICLGPTGNMQGTYKFLSLKTGKIIKRRKFDEYPVPDSIVTKVNTMGRRDHSNGRLRFCDRHNQPFDWDDQNEILIEDNAVEPEPAPFPDIPAEMPGVEKESDYLNLPTTPIEEEPAPTEEELIDAAIANANFGPREAEILQQAEPAGVGGHYNDQDIVINLDIVPANDGEIDDPEDDDDEIPGLVDGADSSDSDSDFEPDDEEDIELEDMDDEPLEDFDDTDEEDAPRRSQRQRVERDFFVPNQESYMHAAVSD
jgi:hypothetical protein